MNPSPYPAPFSSAHMRARIVKILLIVGAIATGMSLLTEALSLAFPLSENQELDDNPIGALVMLMVFLFALLELILYVSTVIFFAVWFYRAYDNLRAFAASPRLNYTATLAVGSFFIPFANLIIPYRAVKEAWEKSGTPDEGLLSAPSAPAWFPIWWTFWLLSSFAGNVSFRVSFNENVPQSTATMISIGASALSIIAAALAYVVVDAIDKRQEETSKELKLGKFSGPPPLPDDYLTGNATA